jgi:uncharacterized membrane protein
MELPVQKNRVESIDILRGLVMIIMALDHVRDYFHISANVDDPLNLATTTPYLFFTRWITHFCAPVFVFLSGTSIYLQSLRKTKKELSAFLIKRGLWLIFLELVVVTFGWSFNIDYNLLIFQVIWAIGISMTILGCLIHLSFNTIVGIGLTIVLLHNLLDFHEAAKGYHPTIFMDFVHHGRFAIYTFAPNHSILIGYAFLPWTGLMMLGYGFGKIMQLPDRKKRLNKLGLGLITLFVLLRFINVYGDPTPWTEQPTAFHTFLSFISINKYPPSLLYMCITIGPALLFLSFIDTVKNKATDFLKVFGRVALFYYLLHLYFIHLFAIIDFFMSGHTLDQSSDGRSPFKFVISGEGHGLLAVYGVWILLIVLLYPLCKWYDAYKTRHKEKWWLSYL